MKKSKTKLRLKQLFKDTLKDALNTGWLEFQIAKFDSHQSMNEVKSLKWYSTRYLPFAQMVFERIYKMAGNKMDLPDNHSATYWKRFSQALSLCNKLSIHYNKVVVAQQLCDHFTKLQGRVRDPLEFILEIQTLSGAAHILPEPKAIKDILNNQINSGQSNHPLNCFYCKKRKCTIKGHKSYWRKRNKANQRT